ncbi:hypothetical protein DL770_002552 [Monosporascus sp. CRB-9-2]|nr:hypothetical protein DL770_002552 [Monosporascus sp. CRB-9-2]
MAGSARVKRLALSFSLLWLPSVATGQYGSEQIPLNGDVDYEEACPDYTKYAAYPHRPLSEGPLGLPFQRPHPKCRTFHSDAIEKVIEDVTSRMKDSDLARLFENAFPSTTDTTVKFHTTGTTEKKTSWRGSYDEGKWEGPHSFIITGDIIAEWLRDSTNQLSPYQSLAKKDRAIHNLILGAINTQSEYVIESPYCNAFQPPPISGLPITHNGQSDVVHPVYEPSSVFECKYELDSLAHFLTLANDFYDHTGSTEFLTPRWYLALETVLDVLQQQSQSTFDPETGRYRRNQYTFSRNTNTGTETLNLNGVGNPLNNGTGLIRSAFRPSDDATILGFFIPANAQMAVQLKRTAAILKTAHKDALAQVVQKWSKTITDGVWEHGVVHHKLFGNVFAYEVDGYGSSILMDDANYPSLLALPVMGFVGAGDETYQNTRRMLLSKSSNPYYLTGREFHGIGGPHIGLSNAWPMSLLIQAQTSDDDDEILECLQLVLNSSKLGLVHESVDVNMIHSYTRSWFAYSSTRKIFDDEHPALEQRTGAIVPAWQKFQPTNKLWSTATTTTATAATATMTPPPQCPEKQINLMRGWPAHSLLPAEALRAAAQKALSDPSVYQPGLEYGPDQGYQPLREALARWLSAFYSGTGVADTSSSSGGNGNGGKYSHAPDAGRIVITGGASQSLACLLQSFTDPALTRRVWMLAPCYFLACPIFADAGFAGRMRAVPEDAEGVDLGFLERELRAVDAEAEKDGERKGFKDPGPYRKIYRHVIYCVPSFANPSGKTMSLARREGLVRLAREFDALVICDDVYDQLQWPVTSPDATTLTIADELPARLTKALLPRLIDIDLSLGPSPHDPSPSSPAHAFGHVVSNGSFSKLSGPGVRTGWTESSAALARGASQTGSTRSGGAPSQLAATVLAELLSSGGLDAHVARTLRPAYRRRHALLLAAVCEHLVGPLGARVSEAVRTPSSSPSVSGEDLFVYGGYFLWISFPEDSGVPPARAVAERCLAEENLVVGAGPRFEVHGDEAAVRFERDLRLCFAWEDEAALVEGVERLARVIRRMMDEGAGAGAEVADPTPGDVGQMK